MVLVSLAGGTGPGMAQPVDGPVPSRPLVSVVALPDATSPAERLATLQRWTSDYTEWKAWFDQWRNRREPGWFGTRERRPRPDPPGWLIATCPVPSDEAAVLVDGCRLLVEWRTTDIGTTMVAQQVTTARTQHEATTKTVWWQHVHLDALWPMTQGTSGVFGLVGLHTTIRVSGRVQVFVAPGAILMRVPGIEGGQQWKPATDWGFSYRVLDFIVPGARRPATLHVNLAKVWLLGGKENLAAVSPDMYLAGFSLTFRKAPTR